MAHTITVQKHTRGKHNIRGNNAVAILQDSNVSSAQQLLNF